MKEHKYYDGALYAFIYIYKLYHSYFHLCDNNHSAVFFSDNIVCNEGVRIFQPGELVVQTFRQISPHFPSFCANLTSVLYFCTLSVYRI